MGFFDEAEQCCICGKNKGKKQIVEGKVCKDCISLATPFLKNKGFGYKNNTKQDFYEAITQYYENEDKLQSFILDDQIIDEHSNKYGYAGDYLRIDNHHKWLYTQKGTLQNIVFDFSDIENFEIEEYTDVVAETKQKNGSGVGRAVVGGALFGPAGAVVGAATKKKKTITTEKEIVSKITVCIKLKNSQFQTVLIDISNPYSEVIKGDVLYRRMLNAGEEILNKLQEIQSIESKETQKSSEKTTSVVDELLKLKQLYDDNLLTQEEFNVAKNKLLNL